MKYLSSLFIFVMLLNFSALAFGAHYSGKIEGYYSGHCDIDGDYRIIRTYSDFDMDTYDRTTYRCDNFSIFPSIAISGKMIEEYSDDPAYDHIIFNGTIIINDVHYNVETDISEDWENDTISGRLKVNGQDYPVNEDIADIFGSLIY